MPLSWTGSGVPHEAEVHLRSRVRLRENRDQRDAGDRLQVRAGDRRGVALRDCEVREVTLLTPPLHEWPDHAELRYRYEERAGIKEFQGGTPRAQAEEEARLETWAEFVETGGWK